MKQRHIPGTRAIAAIMLITCLSAFLRAASAQDCDGNGVPDNIDKHGALYIAESNAADIYRIPLFGGSPTLIHDGSGSNSFYTGLAIDKINGKMYVVNGTSNWIYSLNVDGTGYNGSFMAPTGDVRNDISLRVPGQFLYTNGNCVFNRSVNGEPGIPGGCGLQFPLYLDTVTPNSYLIYGITSQKIQLITNNGGPSNQIQTVVNNVSIPGGMVYHNNQVFWTNPSAGSVMRADISCNSGGCIEDLNVTTIYTNNGNRDTLGITIDRNKNHVYFFVDTSRIIYRCNLDGSLLTQFATLPPGQRGNALAILPISENCNENQIIDECEPDCDGDGIPDDCEIDAGAADCNANGIPDDCEATATYSDLLQVNDQPAVDPTSVIAVDIDGNGVVDAVSASAFDNKIAWYTGPVGNSPFGPQMVINSVGDTPIDLEAADIDGDGDPDLVACFSTNATIYWFGNMTGEAGSDADGFDSGHLVATGTTDLRDVAVADLDGDGDADILGVDGFSSRVYWFENTDGLGTFSALQLIEAGHKGANVIAADLDGDGDQDVIVGGFIDAPIVWHENIDGEGSFGPRQIISIVGVTSSLSAADVDGDGDLDLVTSNCVGGQLNWYRNDGTGDFGSFPLAIATGVVCPGVVAMADVDNDGDLDAVAGADLTYQIYHNTDGLGSFSGATIIANSESSLRDAIDFADFNGDGSIDFLVEANNVYWIESLGSDCDSNGIPDDCELTGGSFDCNGNGVIDTCDIGTGAATDCNENGVPDSCESLPDCNSDGIPDVCQLFGNDCNGNGTLDACELAGNDCNNNAIPDDCELSGNDCNTDGIPDECQLTNNDCNGNDIPDECELALGDCNTDGIPDECQLSNNDCNADGIPDDCQLITDDCNGNGVLDACEIAGGIFNFGAAPNTPIPDNNPVGITSVIDVPIDRNLNDLNVNMHINHTWQGDIVATLEHNGTVVTLINNSGGLNLNCTTSAFGYRADNFGSVGNPLVLDDAAPVSIDCYNGPTDNIGADNYAGPAMPNQPLAAFNGMNAGGEWTLTVSDPLSQEIGTLVSWSLDIDINATAADCNGNDILDECELDLPDCNADGIPDDCQLSSNDCNTDGILDDCQLITDDCNSNGILDACEIAGGIFKLGAAPNMPIPDNDPVGITSVVNVPFNGTVNDVDVNLHINHTWQGDIIATLEHNGTFVTLIKNSGGVNVNCAPTAFGYNSDNFGSVGSPLVLDDSAPVSIDCYDGPADNIGIDNYAGPAMPNQPLAAFNGMSAGGEWTLTVSDPLQQETGTLVSWSLDIAVDATAADCNGNTIPDDCELNDVTFYALSDATDQILFLDEFGNSVRPAIDLPGGNYRAVGYHAVAQLLLYSNLSTDEIRRVNLDGSDTSTLISGSPQSRALDFEFPSTGTDFYYCTGSSGGLYRSTLGGTTIPLVENDPLINNISGIALDEATNAIYFTDQSAGRIWRRNLITAANVQIASGLAGPLEIELDRIGGKLYFTEYSGRRVRRANLDGSGLETIYNSSGFAGGLELDIANGTVYFTDVNTDQLLRCDLDGSDLQEVAPVANVFRMDSSIISTDCNGNGVPDSCDIPSSGDCCMTDTSPGCNVQAIQDCVCAFDPFCCDNEWDSLCVQAVELLGCGSCSASTFSNDCNFNFIPDECETENDCNGNLIPDECENPLQGCGPGEECPDAIAIDAGTFTGDLGDNLGTTGDDDACGNGNNIDEWYRISVPFDTVVTITTCNGGTQFDSVLSVFDGCPIDGGAQIACNNDTTGAPPECGLGGGNLNRKSTVMFGAIAGEEYLIRVSPHDNLFNVQGGFGTQVELTVDYCFKGDINEDYMVDAADVPLFVERLIDITLVNVANTCDADMNDDGFVNGADLQGFVFAILGS